MLRPNVSACDFCAGSRRDRMTLRTGDDERTSGRRDFSQCRRGGDRAPGGPLDSLEKDSELRGIKSLRRMIR